MTSGSRAFDTRWPRFSEEQIQYIVEPLRSHEIWRGAGRRVDEFEAAFARHEGGGHCVAVSSGTVAIELALRAFGLKAGDEVLVPAMTFVSTASAVVNCGATPVLYDVNVADFNCSLDSIAASISERTRAVICVHMAGEVCDLDALEAYCKAHDLFLLQDAAHAPSGEWKGRRLAAFGDAVAYSFQGAKLLTSGEGGAIIFWASAHCQRAFLLHNCGRPIADTRYAHELIGSNLRMTEIAASMLLAGLPLLRHQSATRLRNYDRFRAQAEHLGFAFQRHDAGCTNNPLYMAMFLMPDGLADQRDRLVAEAQAIGLPLRRGYRSLDEMFFPDGQKMFESREDLKGACEVSRRGVWLPHQLFLCADSEVQEITDALEQALRTITT